MPRFRVSDGELNTYGFRLLPQGGDPTYFLKNPVGFWNHLRSWRGVEDEVLPICRWKDLELVKNSHWEATPVFDPNDEFARKIESKVEGGFINAASVGVRVVELSDDPKYLLPGQKRMTVTKWEFKEISIVDIPGNKTAVRLFDMDGNHITLNDQDDRFPPLLKRKTQIPVNLSDHKSKKMEEQNYLPAVAAFLGLNEAASIDAVRKEITRLKGVEAEVATLSARLKDLEEKQAAARKAEAENIITLAVKEKRMQPEQVETYRQLFEKDFELAKKMVATLQPQIRLSDIPQTKGDNKEDSGVEKYAGMTFSELRQKEPAKLEKLKADDFETFNALFKSEYGKDYRRGNR